MVCTPGMFTKTCLLTSYNAELVPEQFTFIKDCSINQND